MIERIKIEQTLPNLNQATEMLVCHLRRRRVVGLEAELWKRA